MGTNVPERFVNNNMNGSSSVRNDGVFRLPPPQIVTNCGYIETPRPIRRPEIVETSSVRDYSYNYIMHNFVDYNSISSIVLSKKDLKYPLDRLFNILKSNSKISVIFKDFESALFLDEFVEEDLKNRMFLLDDGKMCSREYIDLTKLKRIYVSVPLTYAMWGVKFDYVLPVYCYYATDKGYIEFLSYTSNYSILKKDVDILKEQISDLERYKSSSNYQNVCLVSDFIQSRTQYVEGKETVTGRGTFELSDSVDSRHNFADTGKIETVLNDMYGNSLSISNLSTLLLNNDVFRIPCESVYARDYSWNRVMVDGKWYYFDNSKSIVYGIEPDKDGLITHRLSKVFLLFGKRRAERMGFREPENGMIYDGDISNNDCLEERYFTKFVYHKKPPIGSHPKRG